jgi:hypothetical protein
MTDFLYAIIAFRNTGWGSVWSAVSSLYGDQSWDDNPGLFGFKIDWNLARTFLNKATLTVSAKLSKQQQQQQPLHWQSLAYIFG